MKSRLTGPYPFDLLDLERACVSDLLPNFLLCQAGSTPTGSIFPLTSAPVPLLLFSFPASTRHLHLAASYGSWACLDYFLKERKCDWAILSPEEIQALNPLDEDYKYCAVAKAESRLAELISRGYPPPTDYDRMFRVRRLPFLSVILTFPLRIFHRHLTIQRCSATRLATFLSSGWRPSSELLEIFFSPWHFDMARDAHKTVALANAGIIFSTQQLSTLFALRPPLSLVELLLHKKKMPTDSSCYSFGPGTSLPLYRALRRFGVPLAGAESVDLALSGQTPLPVLRELIEVEMLPVPDITENTWKSIMLRRSDEALGTLQVRRLFFSWMRMGELISILVEHRFSHI